MRASGRSAIFRLDGDSRGRRQAAAGKEDKGIPLYALDGVIACRDAKKRPALPKEQTAFSYVAQRAG